MRERITSGTILHSKTPKPNLGNGNVRKEIDQRGDVTLRKIREAICSIRRAKLPDTTMIGNAGSFFKNPIVDSEIADRLKSLYPDMPTYPTTEQGKVKLAAGWLIDQAGMKGYRQECVGVHDRQALVLVNYGGAKGCDVINLAHKVQGCVENRFGIEIDTEVNIL